MLAHTCTHAHTRKNANGIIIVGQSEKSGGKQRGWEEEKVFQVHFAHLFLLKNFSSHYVVLVRAHAFVRVKSDCTLYVFVCK